MPWCWYSGKIETDKIPATITESEFAGQYDPADIRGSYVLGEVSDPFELPIDNLQLALFASLAFSVQAAQGHERVIRY